MRHAFRSVGYNLAGQLLPMCVAIVALPLLTRHAGAERLGFLGIAWALIGYFALFDLGLSRVVTRRVAIAHANGTLSGEMHGIRRVGWSLVGAVVLLSLLLAWLVPARWIVSASASPALLDEANVALSILWATVPATVATGLFRGTLEGLQRFGRANALRSVFGVWSFLVPVLTLPISNELPALTLSIAIGRYLALIAHAVVVRRTLAEERAGSPGLVDEPWSPSSGVGSDMRSMFREGGWLSVSNLVGPVMVTFDRFAIARLVSLTAAGFYFVPQEIALRLLVVPGAIAATIFPMLAMSKQGSERHGRISRDALLATATASLLPCVALAALAAPVLTLWMGPSFSTSSAAVASILAVGLFSNCCAQVPFAWIQAAGRPDVTGKLHLLELPFYCVAVCLATWYFGIVGAAVVWTVRCSADFAMMMVASRRLFRHIDVGPVLVEIVIGVVLLIGIAASRKMSFVVPLTVGLVVAAIALDLRMALRLRHHIQQ